MRALAIAILVLVPSSVWLVSALAGSAEKSEALARIEALLDAGELDQAKERIDLLLDKNPGDPDLLAFRDRHRFLAGRLPLLKGIDEGRKELREAAFRIVAATMRGNPEEWDALTEAGHTKRVALLLERALATGSTLEKSKADLLLDRLAESDAAPDGVPEENVLRDLGSDEPELVLAALARAEARKLSVAASAATRLSAGSKSPEIRAAAAGVLLALDRPGVREKLREELFCGEPIRAVPAGRVLFRWPGDEPTAIQDLLLEIEDREEADRARPELLALGFMALARRGEPGARELLEAKLTDPDSSIDAARALGVLRDPASVPALIDWMRNPPKEHEGEIGGGLGYLGGRKPEGLREASAAENLRSILVGALAILRITRIGDRSVEPDEESEPK